MTSRIEVGREWIIKKTADVFIAFYTGTACLTGNHANFPMWSACVTLGNTGLRRTAWAILQRFASSTGKHLTERDSTKRFKPGKFFDSQNQRYQYWILARDDGNDCTLWLCSNS
jgi:hypothetical protein